MRSTGEVLLGKTFSKAGAAGLTGSMPNHGAVNLTPGTADQAIVAGYHDGSGKVVGDPDLTAGNIRQGANIFNVTGTSIEASGNAVAGDVLAGKTFSKAGVAGITGSMPDNGAVTLTPWCGAPAILAGYHNGSGTVVGDTDLAAGNIKNGVAIFGVTGAYRGWTCTGTMNGTRWCDNGNGTVRDMTTGLIWLKNSGMPVIDPTPFLGEALAREGVLGRASPPRRSGPTPATGSSWPAPSAGSTSARRWW